MTSTPSDVTVIVRSIGHPLLSRAIESLIRQTYRPQVVVVVARPGALLPEPVVSPEIEVRYLRNETPLLRPQAANAGLRAVKTPFFMFLDEDDCFEPDHIELLRDALHAQSSYDIAFARMHVWEGDQIVATSGSGFWRQRLWAALPFWIHTALCRTRLRDAGVSFDDSLAICEDWDFWIQCSALTDCWFVDRVTANYFRDTGSSGTGSTGNIDEDRITRGRLAMNAKWSVALGEVRTVADDALRTAQQWMQRGDIVQAQRVLTAAIKIDRGNPQILNWLAACALQLNDASAAAAHATRALQTDPLGLVLWLQLARAATRLNDAQTRDHALDRADALAKTERELQAVQKAKVDCL